MKRNSMIDQKGMGLGEMLLWAGLLALLGWAAWQFYLNPESRQPRPAGHHAYEDTQPSN